MLRSSTVLLAVLLGASAVVSAQSQQPSAAEVQKAIEQLRSDARKEINALISDNMRFSADEAAKFWPLYKEYETGRKALTDERLALIKDYADSYSTMSDDKAIELMNRALALEEKALAAKRAFLQKLEAALPGKTVARFNQVHNRIDMMVDLMLANQVPLMQ
jgi:hypothetical protein